MSTQICFDRVANAKRILKTGISPTSNRARHEIREAVWYLLTQTKTYTQKQVEQRLLKVSSDYFLGLPEDYITERIQRIITSTKNAITDSLMADDDDEDAETLPSTPKSVTIYKSELAAIEALNHPDTERLAFVFLAYAKYMGYKYLYECNSSLYWLAWCYVYDEKEKTVLKEQSGRLRVGGNRPATRIEEICKAGIVRFKAQVNTSYIFNQNDPPAVSKFTVPIICDSGEVAFVIEKMDEESLVLYYDRYKGYEGILNCCCCGRPVFKSNNKKKYCPDCAEKVKRGSKKSKIGA